MTTTEQKYNKWKLRKEAFKKLKEMEEYERYVHYKVLNLHNNNIKEIPSEIKVLKDLEILILYHDNTQQKNKRGIERTYRTLKTSSHMI